MRSFLTQAKRIPITHSLFNTGLRSSACSVSQYLSTAVNESPTTGPVIKQTLVRHPISMLDQYLTEDEKNEIAITASEKFAVIQLSGTQYKVAVDDVVVANLIHGYDIGESIEIKDVLLVGTQNDTVVGRPLVDGASVVLEVEEHTKDEKVIIFKKKRRKNYKRKTGFRRDVTILRVTDIQHIFE